MINVIADFLKESIEANGWTIPQFAHATGVNVQLAYKWLAEDSRLRTTPSPSSCEKIAGALGLSTDAVLAMAGHRPEFRSEQADPAALTALIALIRKSWDQWGDAERRVITAAARALGGGSLTISQPLAYGIA